MNVVRDSAQREAALDIATSFCVQAPAGSGKTELLTQRLLRLLAHVERPEEILAFTFTRRAAAEMRERLLRSLRRASEREAAPPQDRPALEPHQMLTHNLALDVLAQDDRRGWQLLHNPQRLRLNTIDSFTAWLAAQLPLSAGFGARAALTTDTRMLFREAIHATLGRLDDSGPAAEALRQLLPHLQNDLTRVEGLLFALLTKREQWLDLALMLQHDPGAARDAMEQTLADLVADELAALNALLAPHATLLLNLARFCAGNLKDAPEHELHALPQDRTLPDTDAASLASWQILARFLLVKSLDGFRRRVTVKEGFPGKKEARGDKQREAEFAGAKADHAALCEALELAGALPQLQRVARLPAANYDERQWELLSALCSLLPILAAELNVTMQQAGTVDHTETSLAALRALGTQDNPTDLALRLDYRIRHILVDEFQDTSTLQFQLLERLTAGWEPGDGRTLFIVGDGMQSCYAFRNAKVSLFLRARDRGIGTVRLRPLELQVNFRSDASVVAWVNTVFDAAFPQLDDLTRGGVRYSPSVARRDDALTPGVHCHLWVSHSGQDIEPQARRVHEAEAIADLCVALQREDADQSIAVLVRSRNHLQQLVPALRAKGLRWNASKIDPLLSYPVIGDLFVLLRVLLSVADHTAWYALLRSPCIGLALRDLLALADHGREHALSPWSCLQQHDQVQGLSGDARARISRAVPALQQAWLLRRQRPLRDQLEELWIALGGHACITDKAILQNVATFFTLVGESEAHGDIADLALLEEKLGAAYGSAVDPGVKLQLMTIHNAKGLEFDVVLLPGLDRITRSSERPLLLWHEHLDAQGHGHPLLSLMAARDGDPDPLYDYLLFEQKQRDTMEATRLLYIAVTRAARTAWLFGHVADDAGEPKAPANSLLQRILPTLLAAPESLGLRLEPLPSLPAPPDNTTAPRRTSEPLLRLPAGFQPPAPGLVFPPEPAVDVVEAVHTSLLPRTVGDLVHVGLKLLVERGPQWLPRIEQAPWWRQALAPLCPDEAMLRRELARVRAQLEACLNDSEVGWLFDGSLREDACELPLVDLSGPYRRDYVIDRTFIDRQGIRWIVDYKSAQPAPGETEADFIAAQKLLHVDQLRQYARLLGAGGAPPRCALLLTALPRLVEIKL